MLADRISHFNNTFDPSKTKNISLLRVFKKTLDFHFNYIRIPEVIDANTNTNTNGEIIVTPLGAFQE